MEQKINLFSKKKRGKERKGKEIGEKVNNVFVGGTGNKGKGFGGQ